MWSFEDDVILSAATYYKNNKIPSLLNPKSPFDPPQFELPEGDSLSKDCGRILITINRLLVFHCTFCNLKYGSLFNFLQHISAKHLHGQKESEKSTINAKDNVAKETPSNKALEPILFLPLEVDNSVVFKSEESSSKRKTKKKFVIKTKAASKPDIKVEQADELETIAEKEPEDFENNVGHQDEVSVSSLEDFVPTMETKCSRTQFAYECDKCAKVFKKEITLTSHLLTHSNVKNYKCEFCERAFKLKGNLNAHQKRHTNEKKYSCELCDKRFFTSTDTAIHQRIHTGERPYVCSQCGKDFKCSSNLAGHVKRHSDIRTKKCDICEKTFLDNFALKNHMAGHSSERPFVCTYCSASFTRQKTLTQHLKLHINAREYECNLCEKSFNQKPALLAHINNNHKVIQHVES